STVEDGCVFEIEDIQPPEWAGFPPAYLPVQEFLAGLLVYLTPQKIAEMSPKELFKFLQVAIVVERSGEVLLAVRLPMPKELLDGVPLPAKGFTLFFRFQWRHRLRTVAVNAQLRHTPVLACMVQRPANVVLCSRARCAPIRHP